MNNIPPSTNKNIRAARWGFFLFEQKNQVSFFIENNLRFIGFS